MRFMRTPLLIGGLSVALLATTLAGCGGGGRRRNPVSATVERPEKSGKEIPGSEANARIRAALDRGDAKTAERLARKRIESHPADGEAHRLLARSLVALNRPDEDVKKALEKAEVLQPGDASVRQGLAGLLDADAAGALEAGDPEKAIRLWKRCLAMKYEPRQTEKRLAEAYRRLGETKASAGRPAEAEKAFREAIGIIPDSPMPRLDLAKLLMDGDRLVEAQRELKELVDAHPNFEAGLVSYASLLRRMGDVRGALRQVEQVLEFAPRNAEALTLKADLANTIPVGQAESPSSDQSDEPDADTVRKLARLESAGDLAGQQALLETYLAAHPDAAWAKLRQATLYERMGRHEDALALVETYLSGSPDDLRARLLRARCLQFAGRTDDALQALNELASENKATAQVFDETGLVYAKLGRFAEAGACWKRALSANPSYAPAMFNIGQLAMEQGKADEARDWFDKALAREPANLKFRYFAGLNLKQAGMEPEAKAVWESAKAYLAPSDPYALRIAAALGKPLPAPAAPAASVPVAVAAEPLPVAIRSTSVGNVVVPPSTGSETSDPVYQAALESARAGRYQEAIDGFGRILAASPTNFNARMNLGNVYMAMNRPSDAAAHYLLALKQERSNANALKALSRAYDELGLRGHAAGLAARATGASADSGVPAATTRSNPRAFGPFTKTLLANGLAEEALSIVSVGVAENPDSPELALLQGDVYLALRQDAQAESAFRRALEIDGQNPAPLVKLGDLYWTRRQTDAAVLQYQAALKSPLIDPDTMFGIVERFNRLGRRTDAAELLGRLKGMNLSETQLAELHRYTGSPSPSVE
ncbi:MAG TPA: tetratricopeptide repeat protein [Candidatus Ozemobacteraceae bacterium]|nr:tetratricopeptide repeat protein [Candidatus Ozemobacteraceae bacterium]HQG27981.1 tetratricopeptide repeat protein [Candidatus Ozemobacteraceae bacterium]